MWRIKERIAYFLVISVFLLILFAPTQGACVVLKGNLVKDLTNKTPLSNVLIYLYDWDFVKVNGLAPIAPVGITTTTVGDNNFAQKGVASTISLSEDKFPLNKEYLLLFSTQEISQTVDYPSFFYGAYVEADYSNPTEYKKRSDMDPTKAPRIKLTSGTFDLGTFTPNDVGVWLFGYIKDENGNHKKDVGIEVYADKDGVPVLPPYPFYRFIRTDEEPTQQGGMWFNFKMGGFVKNTTYYIRVIANDLGYLDTFYKDGGSDEPREFKLTENFNAGDLLLKPGATIWGYIKDKDGVPVDNAKIFIQTISYTDDQEVKFAQHYVHDPNVHIYDNLPDVAKRLSGFDRHGFSSDGKYELKGLPFEDHDYYIVATELPGEVSKKFATPLFYDGNDGVFNINKAKTVSLSSATSSERVDFFLKDGACIEGYVSFAEEISNNVKTVLDVDPNVCGKDTLPLYIDAYQVDKKGSLLLMGQNMREGEGPFALCGLPPGDYIIKAYDLRCKFYPGEFYDNQPTYITAKKITVDFGDSDPGNDMVLALGGILSGRVLDSSGNPLSKAAVFVNQINAGNPLLGYYFVNSDGSILAQYPTETDPNGRFYVWGLPEGLYTIFVNGVLEDSNTGYLPQFYDPNNSDNTMLANQASPIFVSENNPDFMPIETIQLTKTGDESGGIISGSISLDASITDLVTLSINAFFLRLYDADTGIEISNPLYRFYDPNDSGGNELPYSIMIPSDGEYVLSVQDTEGNLLPHYYRSLQSTVDPDEADTLVVNQANKILTNKNFVLIEKGAEISGKALDPDGKGISGMYIYARQQVLEGPDTGTWKIAVQTETDPNGAFTLKSLYLGTYIFSTYDPSFRYASMYYHPSQELYTPEGADEWIYDLNSSVSPPTLIFNFKKGSKISGKVSSGFEGTQIYAYLMREGKPVTGYSTIADPNFNVPGLTPGQYILGYKDPNLNYLPIYYTQSGFTTDPNQASPSDITVGINTTTYVGEMSFSQPAAKIEGQIRKETETTTEPMGENTFIFLYRMSNQKEFWAITPSQFTAVDSNGEYTLKGLAKGKYTIIAFGPQYRPISKVITIEDADLGSVRQGVNLTFPLDWINLKYDHTLKLEKGLNLVAYPTRIPPYVTGYTSLSFLKDIVLVDGRGSMSLRTFSTDDQEWKSTSFGNADLEGTQITGVHGKNFYLSNGQGFLLYSQDEPMLNFRYFPGQTALWLKKGKNLVGNVAFHKNFADVNDTNLISDLNFTTRKMLAQMGQDASISIQTLDAKAGKWQATYWMWGKPAGTEVKVEDERGYLVNMEKDLDNWYPTNNN